MRLPFVLRATYDHRVESYHLDLNRAISFVDAARAETMRERQRYDEAMAWNRTLVQQIVDLKKDGFRAPKPVTVPKESATAREIEEIARMGAREEFIQLATAQLMEEQQLSASDARDTAEGLADALYAQNVEGG